MKKRWIILMTLIVIISLIGVLMPENPGLWEPDERMNTANVAWMITATIFVLMMTPGLSFFYGGMVGKKNVISTILQSFIAMGVVSVIWVVFGFSLAFGDDCGDASLLHWELPWVPSWDWWPSLRRPVMSPWGKVSSSP